MLDFTTLVGQYNSSALTLASGQYGTIALDSSSRIIQDHATSSIKIGNGTILMGIFAEDTASAGGENGIVPLWVRQDTLASSVDTDGDFATGKVDSLGALWVHDDNNKLYAEDTAHVSGDMGRLILAVRNDAGTALAGTDGDYIPLSTDATGNLRVTASIDMTPGTEGDVGSAELTTGEVGSIGLSTWVDIVSIPVTTGTYYICEVDGSADKLCNFRLVVWDASQDPGDEVVKIFRKFLVTENIGTMSLNFGRHIEMTGGADLSLKLQAIRLRAGATNANASGGINGYTI
jgi:hypothetical protein